MHIALYFHGRLPVSGYGGTQRVLVWLARGLVQLVHRVTLLAAEGPRVLPPSLDLLHAHARLEPPPECPHVFTLHGNLGSGVTPSPNTIFLSGDHARRHGARAFVYNGVDPSEFVRRYKGGRHAPRGRAQRLSRSLPESLRSSRPRKHHRCVLTTGSSSRNCTS
jgi:hypothetical protein